MKLALAFSLALLTSACLLVGVETRPSPDGARVLLCHKGKKTMELPQGAARAHLDHGDRYGSC